MKEEIDLRELERYLRLYQENPDSRIFAPLADIYRRMGRLQEAEEICREGIRRHPYYAGGKVALAHVFFDKGSYQEALQESEAVVTYYPENILARKLLIKALAHLGRMDRSRIEYETLKQVSPLVGADKDIERLLQSGGRSLDGISGELPMSPRSNNVLNIKEKTAPSLLSPQEQRSKRLQALVKKKLILQTWLSRLGTLDSLR